MDLVKTPVVQYTSLSASSSPHSRIHLAALPRGAPTLTSPSPTKADPGFFVSEEGQVLPAGSLVQRWDFVAPAGPAALTAADRQPWRLVGDPEADEIVEILGLGPGADALTGLENEAERDGGNATVRTFWHKMSAGPKDEVDHGLIKEGQQVYRR